MWNDRMADAGWYRWIVPYISVARIQRNCCSVCDCFVSFSETSSVAGNCKLGLCFAADAAATEFPSNNVQSGNVTEIGDDFVTEFVAECYGLQ
jgi:hypothetical protein